MNITVVKQADKALLDGINALLPQLTPTFTPLTAKHLDHVVASPCCWLFIAMEDAHLLGMLTLVIFPIPSGVRAWIEDLVVGEAARGKGIALDLGQHALAHAKLRGADNVNLTARADRKAADSLYRKLGFEYRQTNVYRYNPCKQEGPNLTKEKNG